MDRRRASRRWTCGTWTSAASAPHYRSPSLHAQAHARRSTRPTTTSTTRAHERQAGRPLRVVERVRVARGARRGVRREVGLGAGQLVRVQRGRRRRVAAPARLGRAALVAGDRRRAPRHAASAPALFDESSFAKIEVAGPGAAAFLESLCDNRVARDVGRITYTQMLNSPRRDRVRLHRHAGGARSCSRSSPAPRSATTTSRGSAGTRRATARCAVSDVTARWACFALWGPRARDVLAPLTPDAAATSPT